MSNKIASYNYLFEKIKIENKNNNTKSLLYVNKNKKIIYKKRKKKFDKSEYKFEEIIDKRNSYKIDVTLNKNSHTNYMFNIKKYYTNLLNNIINKEKGNEVKNIFIIHPQKIKIKIWNFLFFIIILYSILISPILNIYNFNNSNSFINHFEVFVDLFFIIDWIKNFFLTYKINFYEYEIKLKNIFTHYLVTWFLLDLITSIPISIIIIFNKKNYQLNGLKIIKSWRILKFIFNLKNYALLLNFIKFKIRPYIKRIIKVFLIICLLFHNISCNWIIIGKLNEKKNWIISNNLKYNKFFNIYITSLYWTTQTIFTVGYGDVGAFNKLELLFSIIIMFIGVFIFSFLISSISFIIQLRNNKIGKFQENILKLKKIDGKYKLPKKFYKKIYKFLKYNQDLNSNENELINNLYFNLKKDLNYEMNNYKLDGIIFFKIFHKTDFISDIIKFLKLIYFEKNEYIFKEDEYSDMIFFVKKGSISLLKNYKNKTIEVLRVKEGSYIGGIELICGKIDRLYSAKCLSDVELWSVDYKNFEYLIFNKYNFIGLNFNKLWLRKKLILNKIFELNKIERKVSRKTFERNIKFSLNKKENDLWKFSKSLIELEIKKTKSIKNLGESLHYINNIELNFNKINKYINFLNERLKNKKFKRNCVNYFKNILSNNNMINQKNSKSINYNDLINKYNLLENILNYQETKNKFKKININSIDFLKKINNS